MTQDDPLSIRQLQVFVALTEQRSFTKAARHLRLSQSTVSGHMSDLERRLGVRLVERERSGVRPTEAGKVLLRPAKEVLRAERSARQAVEELSGLLRGVLVVGGSTIPSSYILPAIFARFRAAHPGVALQLVTGDSREVVDRVLNADVEIGVVGAPSGESDLLEEKIAEDRLALILPAGHALAGRKTVSIASLLEHPLVMREEGSGTRAATEKALRACGSGEWSVACEVGSTEAVKAAVRCGLGAAFVSSLAVAEEVAAGALATVTVRGFDVPRSFYLVSRQEAFLSPAALAFRREAVAD